LWEHHGIHHNCGNQVFCQIKIFGNETHEHYRICTSNECSAQVLHRADSVFKTETTKVINNSSLVILPQMKNEKISIQHVNEIFVIGDIPHMMKFDTTMSNDTRQSPGSNHG